MIDLKNASFHYALAHLDLKSEAVFYDQKSNLYRNCSKIKEETNALKRLSVQEIIHQSQEFCKCDDPHQFNLLLSESILKNMSELANHVDRHLGKFSCICRMINKIFNWLILGCFESTSVILLQTRKAVERHTYYLLGRKLSFTLYPNQP